MHARDLGFPLLRKPQKQFFFWLVIGWERLKEKYGGNSVALVGCVGSRGSSIGWGTCYYEWAELGASKERNKERYNDSSEELSFALFSCVNLTFKVERWGWSCWAFSFSANQLRLRNGN